LLKPQEKAPEKEKTTIRKDWPIAALL